MLQLLNACLTAQALHVIAELGIADRMADGPAAIDDLAAATGAHGPSLHRLLRMLVGAGVFRAEGEGRFGLTPLGATTFDQPKVVAGAEPVLRAAGVAERCEVVAGDMLQGVPGGADAYILKRVLMIWGDEPAIRVLRHCAAALPEQGRVLVIEMVMPAGNDPSPARSFDLLMLLANGGRPCPLRG